MFYTIPPRESPIHSGVGANGSNRCGNGRRCVYRFMLWCSEARADGTVCGFGAGAGLRGRGEVNDF